MESVYAAAMRRTLALLALIAGLLGACEPSIPEGVFDCETDADCPPDLVCRDGPQRCYLTREPVPDGG